MWRRAADARALRDFAEHLREGDVPARCARCAQDSASSFSIVACTAARCRRSRRAPAGGPPHLALRTSRARSKSRWANAKRRWQARMRLSADWHWETDRDLRDHLGVAGPGLPAEARRAARPTWSATGLDAVPLFRAARWRLGAA
jgi:hypothetical protein